MTETLGLPMLAPAGLVTLSSLFALGASDTDAGCQAFPFLLGVG